MQWLYKLNWIVPIYKKRCRHSRENYGQSVCQVSHSNCWRTLSRTGCLVLAKGLRKAIMLISDQVGFASTTFCARSMAEHEHLFHSLLISGSLHLKVAFGSIDRTFQRHYISEESTKEIHSSSPNTLCAAKVELMPIAVFYPIGPWEAFFGFRIFLQIWGFLYHLLDYFTELFWLCSSALHCLTWHRCKFCKRNIRGCCLADNKRI